MLIAKERLQDLIPAIAGKMKFRPAIVEKDYYLTVILNNIDDLLSDKIVFKGGTLFNKVHLNYHRLSEDLDFTYLSELTVRSQRSKAITPIREKMPSFLKALGLTSDNPLGEGFNNSTQYVFKLQYPSLITAKNENVKIEISLRQHPLDKPVYNEIKHFYQDPFSGNTVHLKLDFFHLKCHILISISQIRMAYRWHGQLLDFQRGVVLPTTLAWG